MLSSVWYHSVQRSLFTPAYYGIDKFAALRSIVEKESAKNYGTFIVVLSFDALSIYLINHVYYMLLLLLLHTCRVD